MKMSWMALGLACALAASADARDLEQILEEKGVLTEAEARESKGAREEAAPAALPGWVDKLTPSADVRVRNESFFRDGDPDRVRQRFRLRVGLKAAVSPETEIGVKLATGAAADPISNNQSFTDTFTFKDINLTNAYLKLDPAESFGWKRPYLTLLGGKFDTPTYHPTQLQFDGDLTPEGFAESLHVVKASSGTLRALDVNLGQWVFQEISKTSDGALFAFQGVAGLALGDSIAANLGVGDFFYHKPSTIAAARNGNSNLAISNAVRLSDGSVAGGAKLDPAKAGPNGDGKDASGKPIKIVGFESDFNVLDVGADLSIQTASPRLPLAIFGDYVLNTEASGGDDTGWQVGAGIGSTKVPHGVNFNYAYERIETDAVLSAFSFSDFGRDGGTNSQGHILQLNYALPMKGLTFSSTTFIVEPIRSVAGRSDDTEVRWQVDLIGKF